MQYKVTIYILILLAFISFSRSHPSAPASPPRWRPLFENDSSGRTVYGNKKLLLQVVKQGCPIRVAWGEKLPDGTTDIEYPTPVSDAVPKEDTTQTPDMAIRHGIVLDSMVRP